MFENEEFVEIDRFPHYYISTHGRVKKAGNERARQISISDKGFPIITLYAADSKSRYLRQINNLVADAFLPPPTYIDEKEERQFPKTSVWHIDGNLLNCHFENLKWETRSSVLEWNTMNRTGSPKFKTPKVRNNNTKIVYENAFECAINELELESRIMARVESSPYGFESLRAPYMYVLPGSEFYCE